MIQTKSGVSETFYFNPYYKIEVFKSGDVIIKSLAFGKERVLSQWLDKRGYLCCKLNNTGIKVHDLVRQLKGIEKKSGYSVNHIDGNKLNNSIDNIEYITLAENTIHAFNNGLHVSAHPERHGNYKDGRALKSRIKEYKHEWYIKNKRNVK